MPKTTPKDFFLWFGAMLTLYGGVIAFITLLFNYINHAFPDPLSYYVDPYQSGLPYQMASLIVLAPVFLILMRFIRSTIAADPTRRDIWVRRWALFLTVFLAGTTIVVDLIILLTQFLRGEEITIAFVLKVLVVLLVAGAGFMHFLADLWGYWEKNPDKASYINYGVGVLVLVAIISGFFIVGTPAEARLMRFDERKVSDLQNIQWQVVNFWQQKRSLPAQLSELDDPISGFISPRDPQTNEPYEYRRISPISFELCAVFNRESRPGFAGMEMPVRAFGSIEGSWQHGEGRVCFERTIDPERYPPFSDIKPPLR